MMQERCLVVWVLHNVQIRAYPNGYFFELKWLKQKEDYQKVKKRD